MGITSQVELITPTLALEMIKKNTKNRHLGNRAMLRLAAEMTAGRWSLNGETIKIAEDGTLVDGQHRLHAVVVSGVTIQSVVVRGLPAEAQDSVDIGRPRKTADVLTIHDEELPRPLASALNWISRINEGPRAIKAPQYATLTPATALLLLESWPSLRECVKELSTDEFRVVSRKIGMFSAFLAIFRKADKDKANSFFYRLTTGYEITPDDPVGALRAFLLRERQARASNPDWILAGAVIKAWNDHVVGVKRKLIKAASEEEEIPKISGGPEWVVPPDKLSKEDRQILKRFLEGASDAEIARELELTPRTVQSRRLRHGWQRKVGRTSNAPEESDE